MTDKSMKQKTKSALFTVEEINGDLPFYPYLCRKIEQYAKEKYGLDMTVTYVGDDEKVSKDD